MPAIAAGREADRVFVDGRADAMAHTACTCVARARGACLRPVAHDDVLTKQRPGRECPGRPRHGHGAQWRARYTVRVSRPSELWIDDSVVAGQHLRVCCGSLLS